MEQSLDAMKKQGATLVDPADIETLGKFDDSELTVFMYELKADLNAYLARLGPNAPVHTLKDIIEFNERNRAKRNALLRPGFVFEGGGQRSAHDAGISRRAGEEPSTWRAQRELMRLMDKNRSRCDRRAHGRSGVDYRSDQRRSRRRGQFECRRGRGISQHQRDGGVYVSGLPVGISFFGRAWSEPALIRLAYAFEQATKARQKPHFLTTISLPAK